MAIGGGFGWVAGGCDDDGVFWRQVFGNLIVVVVWGVQAKGVGFNNRKLLCG